MVIQSFWNVLRTSFFAVLGPMSSVVTLLSLAVAFWVTKDLRTALEIGVGLALLIVILTLFHAAHTLHEKASGPMVRVLRGKKAHAPFESALALCILSPTRRMAQNATVSLRIVEDGEYHRLLGFGRVVFVQSDGLVQVIVTSVVEGLEEEVKKLASNDPDTIKSISVDLQIDTASFASVEQTQKTSPKAIVGSGPIVGVGVGAMEESRKDARVKR